jgi:hypothetical protein
MSEKPFENTYRPTEAAASYRCPCCKFKTLHGRGCDEICPVCRWHDDGQDEHDAGTVRGGPNRDLSLREAQHNFRRYRAYHPDAVERAREPTAQEY